MADPASPRLGVTGYADIGNLFSPFI